MKWAPCFPSNINNIAIENLIEEQRICIWNYFIIIYLYICRSYWSWCCWNCFCWSWHTIFWCNYGWWCFWSTSTCIPTSSKTNICRYDPRTNSCRFCWYVNLKILMKCVLHAKTIFRNFLHFDPSDGSEHVSMFHLVFSDWHISKRNFDFRSNSKSCDRCRASATDCRQHSGRSSCCLFNGHFDFSWRWYPVNTKRIPPLREIVKSPSRWIIRLKLSFCEHNIVCLNDSQNKRLEEF